MRETKRERERERERDGYLTVQSALRIHSAGSALHNTANNKALKLKMPKAII